MSSEGSPRQQVLSSSNQAIISQDFPIIQADSQSSSFNRLGKFVSKIGQNEWISQMDLFSTPMKLNYQGQECYKTQFGGLSFLTVAAICIFFTVLYQFPNGITFQAPITYYKVTGDMANPPSVFDHTDTFFNLKLIHTTLGRQATDAQYSFLIQNAGIVTVANGVQTTLEMSTSCPSGKYCFRSSDLNRQAKISATQYIQFHMQHCSPFSFDASLGMCIMVRINFDPIITITTFTEETSKLVESTHVIRPSYDVIQTLKLDGDTFTTNNYLMGHLANILSYELDYYTPNIAPASSTIYSNPFSSWTCSPASTPCSGIVFIPSGSVNYHTQNFDDITSPILFFVSLIETLFFMVYFCFVKNYNNNAFHLKLADSTVFLEDGNNKHYNFKSGPSVFTACLLHNNFLVQIIDAVLYRLCQTQIKRQLPLKAQLTIKMIDYGQKSLGEEMVFDQLNSIYQQQNLQPTKIIFQEDCQPQPSQKEHLPQVVQSCQTYFSNKIDQQAFERLCKDHQYYSHQRKMYLSRLLQRHDKNYKLILQLQILFQQYRQQVKAEYCSKEVELPVGEGQEDISAVEMRKSSN